MDTNLNETAMAGSSAAERTAMAVLVAISVSHFLNDMMQSLMLAIYPLLKASFQLNFAQVGLITLTYQATASLLQPAIGMYTDRRPKPYSLCFGMGFTFVGLILLAAAANFGLLLAAAACVGMGSSVFHPESSRVARMASGGRHGLAQSIFQVGGSLGSSVGPLLAASVVIPFGRSSIAWFSLAALGAMIILGRVGRWYSARSRTRASAPGVPQAGSPVSARTAAVSLAVLAALVTSKFLYLAGLNSYYTFYLIEKFRLPVQVAQMYLFAFLFSVALGTLAGGPIGDRFGRKRVIWFSILGVVPLTVVLPYADLFWTGALSISIGLVLASAFPAIVVYAQELAPGKVGLIAGIFFGLAFGIGGLGAAALGVLADRTSIDYALRLCSFLPLMGLLAGFLPNLKGSRTSR